MVVNPLTENIKDFFNPINQYLYNHLYLLLPLAFVIIFVLLISRFRKWYFYRKYKGRSKDTNKWWSWGAYYEHFASYLEKKKQAEEKKLLERAKRREQNRHPKPLVQNNSKGI